MLICDPLYTVFLLNVMSFLNWLRYKSSFTKLYSIIIFAGKFKVYRNSFNYRSSKRNSKKFTSVSAFHTTFVQFLILSSFLQVATISVHTNTKYGVTIIKTKYGLLRGVVVRSSPRVEAYLGIPYASPPIGSLRAPHFGGFWEAAIKVAKGYLFQSLGGAKLTLKELTAALGEIKAILNSTPITPLSTDLNDYEALAPAHLLIGSSLKAILEPEVKIANIDYISYIQPWCRIIAVKTHFWKRCSLEYIQELQGRLKWTSTSSNIYIGSLAIILEDNLPPKNG